MATTELDKARARIRPIKQRVEDELLARPGVTGVDIAHKVSKGQKTDKVAIVVYVKKKKAKSALKAAELIPTEIDGVVTDVVEEEIVLHPARVALAEVEPMVDAATYATLQGGISMGPCRSVHLEPPDVEEPGDYIFVGTLGAIVRDRDTGAAMALTNFHVACVDSSWSIGDGMTQPGRVDGGTCPGGEFGSLTRAALSEHVDGSVITLDSGRTWACQIAEIGNVNGTATAVADMAVRKRGRTTGLTYGTVASVDYSVAIPYGNGLGTRTLKNQIRITVDSTKSTQFGDHGDSGSVVVDGSGNVVGLYFAGSTTGTTGVANPIQFVLDELSVDMCTGGIRIVTRPVICDPIFTKPVVCVTTKPNTCGLVTKPSICTILTTPKVCIVTKASCPIVTRTCPIVTRACPGPDPGPLGRASEGGALDPRAWYGSPSGDAIHDAFWEGYYAALECASDLEDEVKCGSC